MAISYIAGVNGYGYSGGSITLPGGGTENDIYILNIKSPRTYDGGFATVSGWTDIYSMSSYKPNASYGYHRSLYVRRGAGSPPTTLPSLPYAVMYICTLWRGCISAGSPIHTYSINNKTYVDSSLSWSNPSVNTTVAGTMNLAYVMYSDGGGTPSISTPSGFTSLVYNSASREPSRVSSKYMASTGATGAGSFSVTGDGGNQYWRLFSGVTISLAPEPEPAPKPPIIIMCGV